MADLGSFSFGGTPDPSVPSLSPGTLPSAGSIPGVVPSGLGTIKTPPNLAVSTTDDSFFPGKIAPIVSANWNANFKYYFAIYQDMGNGLLVVNQDIPGFNNYLINLQLNPGSIHVSTPFAMTVTATNTGILEESAGTVFRSITLAGNTGVLPGKANSSPAPASGVTKLATSIFPSTVSAIGQLGSAVNSVVANVVGPNNQPTQLTGAQLQATGYYQFWDLYNFLVAYSELKKQPGSGAYRLVFGSAKDGIEYIITPQSFDLTKDKGSPMLYNYNISLLSWGINTHPQYTDGLAGISVPRPQDVGAIKSVLNTLSAATQAINSASGVIAGVQSDLGSIMQVYNSAVLALGAAVGVEASVTNFTSILSNNADLIVKNADSSLQDAIAQRNNGINPIETGGSESSATQGNLQAAAGAGAPTVAPIGTAAASLGTGSAGTPTGETPAAPPTTSPAQAAAFTAMVSDPSFAVQGISALGTLPASVQTQIAAAQSAALATTSGQVRDLVDDLQGMADNQAADTGLMDPTYASTYGFQNITASREATEDDIILQAQIMDSKRALLSTLATGQLFRERDLDPFAVANENLDPTDSMNSPNSAVAVTVTRGSNLSDLAFTYLGDPNRGREIAILNSLRAPYIDEAGYTNPITDVQGREFAVAASNYSIGQKVRISGIGVATTSRNILSIENLGGGQYLLVVDGQNNLSQFIPSTNPTVWARTIGCVGSGDTVLIPNPTEPSTDPLRPTALYSSLGQLEKVFGVDIGLDSAGQDISIAPDGDFVLATGYVNAVQVLRILAETEQGERQQHPEFGLKVGIGQRNGDVTSDDISSSLETQIKADGRFAGADVSCVFNGGSLVRIGVNAKGANGSGVVPVDFEIGRTS